MGNATVATTTEFIHEESDNLNVDEKTLKQLFSDVRQCNYDDMRIRINDLGGKDVINKLRSPYGQSESLLWTSVVWNNKFATCVQKRDFIKKLEIEFEPDFNLTNAYNCNIIHDL
eukprot:147157_1